MENNQIMKIVIGIVLLLLVKMSSWAQSIQYQVDKPGNFILENHLNKCPEIDFALLTKSAADIAEWFHHNNTLIQNPEGFNVNTTLSGNFCNDENKSVLDGYGTEFRIGFSFRYFYIEKGIPKIATGWIAHGYEIFINQPFYEIARPLRERDFEQGDDPALKQAMNEAHEQLQNYYVQVPLEKELAPGINLYANNYVLVSNPGRPSPEIAATVGEVTRTILNYYRIRKESDKYTMKRVLEKLPDEMKKVYSQNQQISVYDVINKEFENLSPQDMDKPAYLDSQDGVYGINSKGNGFPMVKYNPACWDRNLPTTSVQFVSMKYEIASEDELKQFLKNNNQLLDYVSLFKNATPIKKTGELISH
jgi:hypothetical protein